MTAFSVPLPRGTLPSKKVTRPVGVPPDPVTVAVKVTVSPSVIVELVAEVTIVVMVGVLPALAGNGAKRTISATIDKQRTP